VSPDWRNFGTSRIFVTTSTTYSFIFYRLHMAKPLQCLCVRVLNARARATAEAE
jgi:hypothetical protein